MILLLSGLLWSTGKHGQITKRTRAVQVTCDMFPLPRYWDNWKKSETIFERYIAGILSAYMSGLLEWPPTPDTPSWRLNRISCRSWDKENKDKNEAPLGEKTNRRTPISNTVKEFLNLETSQEILKMYCGPKKKRALRWFSLVLVD